MDEPLRLRGKVMWITSTAEASKANPAGMGIEFLYRDDEERALLEAQVERLIKDQLGDRLAGRLLGKDPG
jgi:Tfp pilus assembly protein PilZ